VFSSAADRRIGISFSTTTRSRADDQYVYIGAYNQSTAQRNNTNYVWRSADDGKHWELAFVNYTWKHIHALATYDNKVYLFSGDNTGCTAATLSTCTDGIYQADKGGDQLHFVLHRPRRSFLHRPRRRCQTTPRFTSAVTFRSARTTSSRSTSSQALPMSLKQVPYELGSGAKLADGADRHGYVVSSLDGGIQAGRARTCMSTSLPTTLRKRCSTCRS
jgi:hypothetical protein